MLDAGEAAVPPVCDPLLVEGDVGHEPGCLQEEDRGQGDGTTNAEGLQSWQDLEKQIHVIWFRDLYKMPSLNLPLGAKHWYSRNLVHRNLFLSVFL